MRLDVFVAERFGYTRNKAKQYIESGLVQVNGICITKVSYHTKSNDAITLIQDKKLQWVSRSAEKLDGFLEQYTKNIPEWNIIGARCLDIGSSTGGFTQVLLERGAQSVESIDVGIGQLHESLKHNPRVKSYEKMDIRDFTSEAIYDVIVCDVSFISVQMIMPSILRLANENTYIFILWKPQFEVGKDNLRKTGVPKDEKIILKKQKEWEEFLQEHKCKILHKEKAAIIGEAGNEEWMYGLQLT